MDKVDPDLEEYICCHIIPLYESFDEAHQHGHVQSVIENSFLIAADLNEEVDKNMIYVTAAYHDMGLSGGRKDHEKRSGAYLLRDKNLKKWFTDGQIQTMAQAVEDHRASNKHEPRSIYGKIVAEADRDITYGKILTRCIQYSLNHFPEYDEKQHYERTRRHMIEKYGQDGYLVLWLDTKQNRENLTELRYKLRKETEFRQDFHVAYREVVPGHGSLCGKTHRHNR